VTRITVFRRIRGAVQGQDFNRLGGHMKPLFALAAILLTSTAAQAGDSYSFDIGGRTITIEAPSDCNSTDCISVSIPGVYEYGTKRSKRERDRETREQAPNTPRSEQTAKPVETQKPVAAPKEAAAPATPVTPSVAVAPQPAPAPAPAEKSAPSTVIANAPPTDPVNKQDAPTPVTPAAAATPLGIWMTEKKEGKVRIEQCGANLCGYSMNAKTEANGEKVLINMKPGNNKWAGKIFDPNSGSTYESTIALKGSDTLRVQGCAFGGMFCGGQTWTRVN
jgi:uncharacterized protein (DUF2147 family)